MRMEGLLKTRSLLRRGGLPRTQKPFLVQYSPHRGRAYRNHVRIQHHEGQPSVTFQGILMVESNYRFPFPVFNPEISWNLSIVLVDHAESGSPVVKLAPGDPQPKDKTHDCDLRLLRPSVDEIYNGIPDIVRHPDGSQISPRLFFSATCSSMSSASTSSLRFILASRASIRR